MKKFLVISLFLILAMPLFSQGSEKEGISTAIRKGDAKSLSEYFMKSVDMTVKDIGDVYSKDQAEVILVRFFSQNAPKSFEVKHEGKSKLDDFFYIGDLVTETGSYRLTFFLKKEGNIFRIKQLRIENA